MQGRELVVKMKTLLVFLSLYYPVFTASSCPKSQNIVISTDKTICLRVYNRRLTWEEAKNFCRKENGILAKTTGGFPENIAMSDYRLMFEHLSQKCFWTGGNKDRGTWQWSDGSAIEYLNFKDDMFNSLIWWMTNCAALCEADGLLELMISKRVYKMQKSVCSSLYGFVCQFEIPAVSTTELVTTPLTEWTTASTNDLLRASAKTTTGTPVYSKSVVAKRGPLSQSKTNSGRFPVFTKIKSSTRILGKCLDSEHVPTITMCARLCYKAKGCTALNFNTKLRRCETFSGSEATHTGKENGWEIWEVK